MEKRVLILVLMATFAVNHLEAQDDFGLWGEVNAEKKVSKKLTLDAGVEYRSRDNASETDRWSFGIGADYKLTDWLKAGVGYTFLYDNNHKVNNSGKKYADYWGARHRLNASLTASHTFGRLGVSLRERYQYTYRPEQTVTRYYTASGSEADEHTYAAKSKHMWRNKLQLKYKVDKFWRPFVSAETYIGKGGLDKIRYTAGTELRLNKQNTLELKYIFQDTHNDTDDEGNRHVIGIGYTYKF